MQERRAELDALYTSAALIGGRNERGYAGPSPAQWGRIITAVTDIRVKRPVEPWGALIWALFGRPDEPEGQSRAVAKKGDADWERIGWPPGGEQISFREWLSNVVEKRPKTLEIDAIARLAKSIKDALVEAGQSPGRRSV